MISRLVESMEQKLMGKSDKIELVVQAFLAGGHVLIEDIPGVGKTTLAKSIAQASGLDFSRIQFTPDLMPSDVTGVSIYDFKQNTFELKKGPVFTHVLLADEINRATPKAQSALLEVMSENQVTLDGKTHVMDAPFFVIATQNPAEFEGTFPLPEAQLDRFMVRLHLGYPGQGHEVEMLMGMKTGESGFNIDGLPQSSSENAINQASVLKWMREVSSVHFDKSLAQYIVALVEGTRNLENVKLGASPRASKALLAMARARAWMKGRDYLLPEDVQQSAVPVLSHRLVLKAEARYRGSSQEQEASLLVDRIRIPKVDGR